MGLLALDTSVAIPLLMSTHQAHAAVVTWWDGREVALSGHALVETYSVLTRLPGDVRLTPQDAARLLNERFAPPLILGARAARALAGTMADLGVAGGSVYDALVALTAAEHGCTLATRDARAMGTYEAVGVNVEVAAAGPSVV